MFRLQTKDGETIATIDASSLDEAIDFFCKIKKLDRESLLSIYKVF